MAEIEILHEWLGIPPADQPPSHYRLLGLTPFELNQEVIRNAADRQYAYVKRLAVNEFTDQGQALLNWIMEAKICLLNPGKRANYDGQLKRELAERSSATSPPPSVPVVAPDPRKTVLLAGADPSCDLKINRSTVSSVHCKLIRVGNTIEIKDLASSNGTFVNMRRVGKAVLRPTDIVTLGPEERLVIPPGFCPPAFQNVWMRVIGRNPQCDIRLDHPSVSQFHAKISKRGEEKVLEDLQSTNGTSVVVAGAVIRVTGPRSLNGAESIQCGTQSMDIAQLV